MERNANWYCNDAQHWYSFYWWTNFLLFWGIPILSTLLASNAFASFFPVKPTGAQQPFPLILMTVLLINHDNCEFIDQT
jgi:hypothetical protein